MLTITRKNADGVVLEVYEITVAKQTEPYSNWEPDAEQKVYSTQNYPLDNPTWRGLGDGRFRRTKSELPAKKYGRYDMDESLRQEIIADRQRGMGYAHIDYKYLGYYEKGHKGFTSHDIVNRGM
jgi:hypothetical protein